MVWSGLLSRGWLSEVRLCVQREVTVSVCWLAASSAEQRADAVQIYKAEGPHWPVRVYNLLYEDSQEADKFAAAVAREV